MRHEARFVHMGPLVYREFPSHLRHENNDGRRAVDVGVSHSVKQRLLRFGPFSMRNSLLIYKVCQMVKVPMMYAASEHIANSGYTSSESSGFSVMPYVRRRRS